MKTQRELQKTKKLFGSGTFFPGHFKKREMFPKGIFCTSIRLASDLDGTGLRNSVLVL